MSTNKRVFDQDLNIEVVLDEDNNTRKRARFEGGNQSTSKKGEWYTSQLDDSENYEDIDYGDDDDDDDDDDEDTVQTNKNLTNEKNEQFDDQNDDGDEEQSGDANEQDKRDEGQQQAREKTERCKYWPACNAGDSCTYYHPTTPCRAFPKCRFGRKCLYIHPTCKYNPHCSKPRCPFSHPVGPAAMATPSRRPAPVFFKPAQKPLGQVCKFGDDCVNLMCPFTHMRSEPCRFGSNCLLDSCLFTHPPDAKKGPNSSVYKWTAQS